MASNSNNSAVLDVVTVNKEINSLKDDLNIDSKTVYNSTSVTNSLVRSNCFIRCSFNF